MERSVQPLGLNDAPWSRRGVWSLAIAGGGSLLLAFALLLAGSSGGPTARADGYSRSAIGHLGLVQLLKQLERPLLQNRQLQLDPPLRRTGVVVVAEPDLDLADDGRRLDTLLQSMPVGLLVLPKRSGEVVDDQRPDWLWRAPLLPLPQVQRVLDEAFGEGARVTRSEVVGRWRSQLALPEPEFEGEVQLLHGRQLQPVIDCRDGVLVGRVGDLWLLSDPDLLANHGLGRGDNAALVVGLLDHLRQDGAIVLDETLHGHRQHASVWELLGRFPLVLLPLHLLLLLGLGLWAGIGRFGAPLPAPRALAAGKAFLIDNIAALLGSREQVGLQQYWKDRVRAVAARRHAPRGLGDGELESWLLQRCGGPRAAVQRQLREQVAERPHGDRALQVARAVHEWSIEDTHAER